MASSIYLACFIFSAVLSLFLTRWIRNLATARGWVAAPKLDRHVHTHSVPRLGGVAIYTSFMAVCGAMLAVLRWMGPPYSLSVAATLGILVPALIVFLIGLYDDIYSIGPYWKFGAQSLAAVLLYETGFGIHRLDLLSAGHTLETAVGLPLTVLWVVLVTNAFNLIDGLDGLAAGSALFSTIVVLAVSLLIPNPMVTCLTIVLAGVILGFLRFNFYPASIFLGDSGSLFIGFMLSALALAGSQKAPTMVAVAIPVVSFGFPILDVALSVARRLLSGKPLFVGDDDHIHHKLLKRGLSQRRAVLILYLATAGFAFLSLCLMHNAGMIGLVLLVIAMGVSLGVQQLHYVEFTGLHDLFRRMTKRKLEFSNNLEIRRAAECLTSCTEFGTMCRILQKTLQPIGFDGFQLDSTSIGGISYPYIAPMRRTVDGSLRYFWSETTAAHPAWELKIELTASSGYQIGYFSLFKTNVERPLLFDVDLFSHEFRSSLSGALHRAVSQIRASALREVPVPNSRTAFVSSAD